jgi:hypothetical protein
MSLADQIREHVKINYIEPARRRGDEIVTIRGGDIHQEMGLKSRQPAVSAALGSNKFEDLCQVRKIRVEGPINGANARFTFKL